MLSNRLLPIAAAISCLSGCAGSYFDVGAGLARDGTGFEGGNPTAYFALGKEWGLTRCELQHLSHWFQGPPVSDGKEVWVDQLVCIRRIPLR